jgi:hypothetical protein
MQETIAVCRDCHSAIHRLAPKEKELGRYFNTPQKLASHPKLATFLAWIRKQK